MSLTSELLELSQQLQQEHLFVTTEREALQRLFHNVTAMGEQLFHTAWVASQQKLHLQQFVGQGIHGAVNGEVYSSTNQLETINFVDSYKVFSYHDTKYGELMRFLYERPNLLASLIIEGEKQQQAEVQRIIGLTVTSIYGSCLFQEDEHAVLSLLKTLLDCQVAPSDNPRRLVRRQSTAFSRVYKHLCESLFSARLFLTAALYDPIMRLLMEDEWFFDIDPDKAFVRFPAAEKLRRFGEPGTEEHSQKQAQYRAFIVDKLVALASRFINSIKANIQCFPAGLGWLVSQVYRVLTERGQVTMQEVRASCADLVFALFICPAICDPEPHGITSDVPISHIARHNLMQMAQIIQVLAMSQWEEIDPKVRDIYGRFEKGCMSSVLDLFLEGLWDDVTQQVHTSTPGVSAATSRSAVLLTADDVRDMIGFLRAASGGVSDDKCRGQLDQLLSALPADMPGGAGGGDLLSLSGSGVYTPPPSASPDTPGTPTTERKLFKTKGARKKRSTTLGPAVDDLLTSDTGEGSDNKSTKPVSDVLVLTIYPPGDCPGMMTEKKVLSTVPEQSPRKSSPGQSVTIATPPTAAANPEIQEKRTRFSLSHDQESIGNASDYQEVVSEAASSHSVEDDEEDDPELETEDNFSDMMSANVSGRGSPSISGRDTPLSQAGSVEENNPPAAAAQLPVPVPETVRKQNRVDVTERFGKFEIKAELGLERDECKSTVSDTWSTDVLASDSEPPELNQVDRLEEVAEEMVRPGLLLVGAEPLSEISETASDAWSTDVLASDTDEKHSELLKDLEQDLMSGGMEREDGDISLVNEEGEDPQIDMENLGAVGGRAPTTSNSNEAFPDVFSEDGDRSGGPSAATSKRSQNIVHNFQAGPNLQLPPSSSHRSGGGTPSPLAASGGARSKTRDKTKWRGAAGDESSSMINEFDPLSSSGRRSSRDKGGGGRRGNNSWVAEHAGKSSTLLPGGRVTSRDSGIDIWVNTNGQMSGSSAQSSARSSNGTSRTNSRSMLVDSNLPPTSSSSSRGVAVSSPDSGLHLGSESASSPQLELVSSAESGGTPTGDLLGLSADEGTSSKGETTTGNSSPLLLLDSHFDGQTRICGSDGDFSSSTPVRKPIRGSPNNSKQQQHKSKSKKTPPQIQVTNMFRTITRVPSEESNASDRDISGAAFATNANMAAGSVEDDLSRPFEQQALNLNERRLSSALTSGDPFTLGTETGEEEASREIPVGSLSISFSDSVSIIEEEPALFIDDPSTNTDGQASASMSAGAAVATRSKVKGEGGHSRDGSSGSNQSSSSFRLSGQSRHSGAGDTISIASDDKDFGEGDKMKKSSGGAGFLRSMKDRLHKAGNKKKNSKADKDIEGTESDTNATPKLTAPLANPESTDDILAKYRTPKKTSATKGNSSSTATNNNLSSTPNNNTTGATSKSSSSTSEHGPSPIGPSRGGSIGEAGPDESFFDPANLESCRAFLDAKRKLRLVLSMGDLNFGLSQIQSSSPREGGASPRENPVINHLNTQLAEAINLQNKGLVAQLYEVIRCVKMFDQDGCRRLLRSMREDYRSRSAYVSYLVRCRQGLLSTRNHLQRLLSRINRDKEICSKHLTNLCARHFLENREKRMWKFIADFQKLTMADEKIDLLEQFLQHLYQEMGSDALWRAATETQLEDGQQAIERFLMSRIYTHAMFPNGDGDIMRDQVLQEHLRKLSKVISPNHKDLRIPRMYHLECPWPAAQKEIYMINAYRTPQDKIQCVLRCSQTIMNLLSLASERSVPAADDFMPVLIFVLIKANPFGLLSTVQYVNSFYGNRLAGEEQYWWLQVTAALEFIKTMDYNT